MNTAVKELFYIDTNALITPYNLYYPFDMFPDFWDFMEEKLVSKKIMLLDIVYEELIVKERKERDKLSLWLHNINSLKIINRKEQRTLLNYAAIIQYIQICGFYNEKGLNKWSEPKTADPWLIAAAKAANATVVSLETIQPNLSIVNKTSSVKIPDICKALGVPFVGLFDMMRRLGFRSGYSKPSLPPRENTLF